MGAVTEPRSGCLSLSAQAPDKINQVSEAVRDNLKLTAGKHALSLDMFVRSVWITLHFYFKMHPYRIEVAQQLNQTDLPVKVSSQ